MNKKIKEKIKNGELKSFDLLVQEHLSESNDNINSFIETIFEEYSKDPNEKVLLEELKAVVNAKMGFTELAKKTGLNKESLYKTLSLKGNPTLHTLTLILSSLGYILKVEPKIAV
jgi:probable addiction module antidote protein